MRKPSMLAAILVGLAMLTAASSASAMYHPTVGRWAARDRLPHADAMDLYLYSSGNPHSRKDPSGLIDDDTTLAGGFMVTYWWRLQFFGLLRQADQWLFGQSTDFVQFNGDLLRNNSELREREVDREMKERAKKMCERDVCMLDGPLSERWEMPEKSFRFNQGPLVTPSEPER